MRARGRDNPGTVAAAGPLRNPRPRPRADARSPHQPGTRYRPAIALDTFFLGTHHPGWLRKTDVPLFVSRRRLAGRKRPPRARGVWALDSGGFQELSLHGGWTVTPAQYVAEVRRYVAEIGGLRWAATQDWMCEPAVIVRTGLTVAEHQRRTIDNVKELLDRAPELPWAPVIQGWTWGDYMRHADAYQAAGIDLSRFPAVGVGSVCRRQGTTRAGTVLACLRDTRARLHGFGFKVRGLPPNDDHLTSADSLAWSFAARRKPALPECADDHRSCQNCIRYALRWWHRVMTEVLGRTLPAPTEPYRHPRLF